MISKDRKLQDFAPVSNASAPDGPDTVRGRTAQRPCFGQFPLYLKGMRYRATWEGFMNFALFAPKKLLSVGAVIACAVGLSGCFDLGEKVAVGRDGSGGYALSIAADGIVGDGLRKKPSKVDIG